MTSRQGQIGKIGKDTEYIHADGEMAEAFRERDWRATALGPIEEWPDPLISAVNSMLNSPFASVLFWGPDLLLLYNDGYRAFMGGKHPAALGKPAIDSWPEVWDVVGAPLHSTLRDGVILNVKNVLIPINVDGRMEDRYWTYCFFPLYAGGKRVAVHQIAFDTTSEVAAARKLRESEMRLRLALTASNGIGTWDWDVPNDLVYADANFARLYGVDEQKAAAGVDIAEFVRNMHPEDQERVGREIDQAVREGTEFGSEYRLVQADGSSRWVVAVGRCSRDEAGAPLRFPGVTLDITDRKLADVALRASETRFRSALETAQLGAWELDLAEGTLTCSNTCKANYGRLPGSPFTYADLIAAIHPEDREEMQAAVRTAIETGTFYRAEYRVVWPDGSLHWVVASGGLTPRAVGEAARVVGVSLDVTDRHLAAGALMQSEKLAAVGRLAASIAHEINNPLESVTNLLYLARDSAELTQVREYLDLAERELRRVSAISNQTLRFHKQSTSPRSVTCAELFESVLSVQQGRIVNGRVQVEKRKRANSPVLCFDGEIRQVLNNLVNNAIDVLSGHGGRLLIRSRETRRWAPGDGSGERGIALTVADTGSGMSAEVRRKIFEPFFTTKGIGGNGLGLWVSQEIVARHNGSLRVRSSRRSGASGTVFVLFLPFNAVSRA